MANEPGQGEGGGAEQQAPASITYDAIKDAGIPDTYLKDGAFDFGGIAKDLGELSAKRTSEAERAKLIPESADKYVFDLPKEFKLPEGVTWDPKAEFAKPVAAWAHANGIPQTKLTELAGIYAQHQIAQNAESAKFVKDEMAKLGNGHEQRLGTLFNSLKGAVGEDFAKEIAGGLTTAASVEAVEKLIALAGGPKLAAKPSNGDGKEKPEVDFTKPGVADQLHRIARPASRQ